MRTSRYLPPHVRNRRFSRQAHSHLVGVVDVADESVDPRNFFARGPGWPKVGEDCRSVYDVRVVKVLHVVEQVGSKV